MTPLQQAALNTRHRVRRRVVAGLLRWLKVRNVVYADVDVDQEALDTLETKCNDVVVDDSIPVTAGTRATNQHDPSHVGSRPTTAADESTVSLQHTAVNIADEAQREASPLTTLSDRLGALLGDHDEAKTPQQLQPSPDSDLLVARRGEFVRLYGKKHQHLPMALPEAFVFGRGGPNEVRYKAISLKRCLQHYLRLSTGLFHAPSTVLLLYQLLATSEAAKSTLYGRVRSQDPADFALVTAADLRAAQRLTKNRDLARRRDAPSPPERHAAKLIHAVEQAHAAMPHSPHASYRWRRVGQSMAMGLGPASAFVTLTPDDIGSALRIKISGSDPAQSATHTVRHQRLADTPGAGALNFEACAKAFLFSFLGWDTSVGLPRPGGGALGVCEGYFGAVEEQGRKTLHLHCIVWVAGFDGLLQTADERLAAYIDSVSQVNTLDEDQIVCPGGHDSPHMTSEQDGAKLIHRGLLRRKRDKDFDPEILYCPVCKSKQPIRATIEASLKKQWALHFPDQPFPTCRTEMDTIIANAAGSTTLSTEQQKLTLAMAAYLWNMHNPSHHPTCFKYSKECRSNLPKMPCPQTTCRWDTAEDGTKVLTLVLSRNVLATYYAELSALATEVYCSNNNIKMIVDVGAVFYICM